MPVDPDALFEWDEAKSARNRHERGFDFEFASSIFQGSFIEQDDEKRDYGERRIIATRQIDNKLITVVYTWRGVAPDHLGSHASKRERHGYSKAFP
jgi:hypothetical protein